MPPEAVRPLGSEPDDASSDWRPVVGEETLALMEHLRLDANAGEQVLREAARVLSRCARPRPGVFAATGLVVGYVQSGKTLSFTTVCTLARDNGFPLVIVTTGISKPLFDQSTRRLKRDLRLETRSDRKWKLFTNPTAARARAGIADTLAEWCDETVPPDERQTVLVTVMKNHRHLAHLNALLRQLDLHNVPVLIIDDEADQAGLNTLVNEQDRSTTYRRLLELKELLPHHSYLQYTATPQAPLLINIIDVLSPGFAEVLTPGADYTGGQQFFVEHPELIRVIPTAEIPNRTNTIAAPPDSLLLAMRLFFLGVAAGLVQHGGQGNRSMLVHPSQERLPHLDYFTWVRNIKIEWLRVLQLATSDRDRVELVGDFAAAYGDLQQTVNDLPAFDELLGRLPHALRRTRELEVNSRQGQTPQIDWTSDYAHILVGGQAMDRGFTVEGLTVTYMPRSLGVGNADTVQQRARFFGYKRSYLGYCRVFLSIDARDAYRSYVVHEEHMRDELIRHRGTGATLQMWKRNFLMSPSLKPTRDEVLDLGYMRFSLAGSWLFTRYPHLSLEMTESNRMVIDAFERSLALHPDAGDDRRTDAQRHLVASDVPLEELIANLLAGYRVARPSDSQRFIALTLHLQQLHEQTPDQTCTVYVMSRGQDRSLTRVRALDSNSGELASTLLQGANAPTGYPGDGNLPSGAICVQVHHLRLTDGTQAGPVIADDVPVLAVRLSSGSNEDLILQ